MTETKLNFAQEEYLRRKAALDQADTEHRRAKLLIDPAGVAHLLVDDGRAKKIVEYGIPVLHRVIHAGLQPPLQAWPPWFEIVMVSPEFDIVEDGFDIPELPCPVLETLAGMDVGYLQALESAADELDAADSGHGKSFNYHHINSIRNDILKAMKNPP